MCHFLYIYLELLMMMMMLDFVIFDDILVYYNHHHHIIYISIAKFDKVEGLGPLNDFLVPWTTSWSPG